MRIVDVPPDILVEVIDLLPPDDLGSFAASCSFLFDLAELSRLPLHRHLLQKYTDVYINYPSPSLFLQNEAFFRHPLDLFQKLSQHPLKAQYVRKISYRCHDPVMPNVPLPSIDSMLVSCMEKTISRCEWLAQAQKDELLDSIVDAATRAATSYAFSNYTLGKPAGLVLLVMALPNLHTVTLRDHTACSSLAQYFKPSALDSINDLGYLSNIKTFDYNLGRHPGHWFIGIDTSKLLCEFLPLLPSLERLHCQNVRSHVQGLRTIRDGRICKVSYKALKTVVFKDCVLRDRDLLDLLLAMPSLETLRYECTQSDPDQGPRFVRMPEVRFGLPVEGLRTEYIKISKAIVVTRINGR